MAIGDNYHTLAELKARLDVNDSNDDTLLGWASAAACRNIEKYCRRQFNDGGSATARKFHPISNRMVIVDDFWTTDSLVLKTDEDDDGTYETVWSSTQYELLPLDGVKDGVPGWPYWRIEAVDMPTYPNGRRPTVELTARWGWETVPAPVKEASLALAEEIFKMKDSPYGIAGFGEFGFVRVRENPKIVSLLMSYRRRAVRVAS